MIQINKILRKFKLTNKRKLILVAYLFIFMFILTAFKSIPSVRAETNYSNYLTSESIDVKNDRALILLEESASANNYRNYYETGFLFPSKLRNEMYSTDLTTNPSKYYVQQAYLDDLDSEYAFSNVENLGQYESNDYIDNYTDITENKGNYNNTDYSNTILYQLKPDSDVNDDWNVVPSSTHFTAIDDIGTGTADYIWADDTFNPNVDYDHFTIENTDILKPINNITINFYAYGYASGSDLLETSFYDGRNWNSKIYVKYHGNNWYSKFYDYSSNPLTQENINDFEIKIIFKHVLAGYEVKVFSLYIQFESDFNYNIETLQESDNNYYNYITDGSGISGLFPAEYSFTSDSDGGNPSGFVLDEGGGTINVISGLDGHNKIVELDDTSSGNDLILRNVISQTSGTVELWIRLDQTNEIVYFGIWDGILTQSITLFFSSDGNLKYDDGSSHIIMSYSADTWYHFRIEFDCSTDWNLWVDGVSKDGGSGYNFRGSPSTMDNLFFQTHNTQTPKSYIDAVDYSWSIGYYENRNRYDSSYKLNITSNLQIERNGNRWDNIENLEFEYTIKSNDTTNLDLYLYNIFSNEYDLIDTKSLTTSFQEFSYVFSLNYTYYSTLGLIDFMFYTENTNDLLISFDKISLKAIFSNFSLNENGYHNINLKFNRKTSGSTNRGNISFNIQLYQNYFTYDYIENNDGSNDYERVNQLINFSNEIEQIYEVEIQYHIRYGLNTLDIDIVNTYVMVIINYNFTFELFEQLRFGNNDGNYFRAEFSYDSINFNRLNNTGIYGNYSMNCLSGLRILRADTSQNFNRYFTIPYFDEKISLTYSLGTITSGVGSEPKLPTSEYWTYETFRLADSGNIGITVENWSVDFRSVEAEKYTAKYPYKSKTIRRSDLGNWKFSVLEQKVSFNFLRNAIADILNLVFLFFQYLAFYVLSGLSYVLMYIGINILVLLWNIIIYWIFVALIWIFWYVYSGIVWLLYGLWDLLLYIYEFVLIPAYIWITEVAVPYLVEFVIIPAIAFTLTLIIWIITLGRLDFWELYEVVETQLYVLSDSFNVIMLELIDHIVEVVIFIGLYLLLIGMCYLKHIVVKVRGYVNRSNALEESLNAYLYPLIIFYKICLAIKQLIANWF